MSSKPSLTSEQHNAIEAARLALAAEKAAPEHTTGTEADGVWRDHFREALQRVTAAFGEGDTS